MKLKVYCDVWKGAQANSVYVTNNPGEKSEGFLRFSFDLEIPDSVINEVDHEIKEVVQGQLTK